MRNDNYSQKIISLHHLYEHEIKINKFYYDFVNASSKSNYTINYLCHIT